MSRFETLRTLLVNNGYNYTRTRAKLFDELLKHNPLSAVELASRSEPLVDRATTYRNLQLFERLAIVKRIWIGFKSQYELTDRFSPHHHHLECLNCRRVITIKSRQLEQLLDELAHRHQLEPLDHQVEITGFCQNCRQQR